MTDIERNFTDSRSYKKMGDEISNYKHEDVESQRI
ncbi:MAG: hypothetical protein sL5_11220 [Candidatus Mesenet longicola]|uniref:Uncharacterized protein n=1 Tax=Candidatus Mesenet longicola TaxID=1892558 RepID=A0A8J3HQB6_9RICK|nr:MAG: hypothetical protein sGL2_11260 [Candidatus Mesenet longicola]GHM60129.1 MAG: hypothetical protein sL5_11220 [Candidatus Mesenet longicola]